MSELKPFPDREKYGGKEGRADAIAKITDGWQAMSEMAAYEKARAEAWESVAREALRHLRIAEHALSHTYDLTQHPGEGSDCDTEIARNRIRRWLYELGPLPKEQT